MRAKEIQELVRLVEKSTVDEIEIREWWGQKIRIRKNLHAAAAVPIAVSAPAVAPPAVAPPAKQEEPVAAEKIDDSRFVKVLAPMVGTFYRAPAPDAEPFVKEGDVVSKGQTLCIIEAMKLMNEIESEVDGRIVKILVSNAQPVEFNQPLFLIDPF